MKEEHALSEKIFVTLLIDIASSNQLVKKTVQAMTNNEKTT